MSHDLHMKGITRRRYPFLFAPVLSIPDGPTHRARSRVGSLGDGIDRPVQFLDSLHAQRTGADVRNYGVPSPIGFSSRGCVQTERQDEVEQVGSQNLAAGENTGPARTGAQVGNRVLPLLEHPGPAWTAATHMSKHLRIGVVKRQRGQRDCSRSGRLAGGWIVMRDVRVEPTQPAQLIRSKAQLAKRRQIFIALGAVVHMDSDRRGNLDLM